MNAREATDGKAWLRDLLSNKIGSEKLDTILNDLPATSTFQDAVNELRSTITKAQISCSAHERTRAESIENAQKMLRAWNQAGGNTLISRLDSSALEEVENLSETCSVLGISAEDAASQSHRVIAVSELAQRYMTATARLQQRTCALAESQAALRGAVKMLEDAVEKEGDIVKKVEERTRKAIEEKKRAELMRIKTEQYQNSERELKGIVNDVGVTEDSDFTHEKLEKEMKEIRRMEKWLKKTREELDKYEGLPPVCIKISPLCSLTRFDLLCQKDSCHYIY